MAVAKSADGVQPRYEALRVMRGDALSGATAQTAGMTRQEAISGRTAGASKLWMGRALAPAGVVSAAHHHGESESAIYVAAGHPSFLFGEGLRQRVDVGPGDFVFVPPWAIHVEANLGDEDAVLIVARSTQEAIVVNLPDAPIPDDVLGRAGKG